MRTFLKYCAILSLLIIPAVTYSQTPKLRVATFLPLTGDAAGVGASFKNGMTLGMEKLSPKAKEAIEFIFEDDKLLPAVTISAFNRVDAFKGVDVAITFSSGTSKALAPITEAKKIPLIGIASDLAVSKGRHYAFNFWVSPITEVKLFMEEANNRGYKNMARIGTIQDGVEATFKEMDRVNAGKIKLVLDEEFPPEVKDFRPFLTKLKAKAGEIDALAIALFPGQLGVLGKQIKELGIKTPLCGFETLESKTDIEQAGGAFTGTWYTTASDSDGAFLKLYQERFPTSSSVLSANGHDAVLLMGAAIDAGVSPDKIHDFLASLKNFSGALGTYSATGTQEFTLPAEVKVVTAKGFESLHKK